MDSQFGIWTMATDTEWAVVRATPMVNAEMALAKFKKPAPTKTLIVVILDESGSMQPQKTDVVGGYQSFIEEQKDIEEDQARLVLIKFNNTVTIQHRAMPLETSPLLTETNYMPRGGTALYDAVAEGIRVGEATVKKDERVLVLIMTDGEENMSKKVTQQQVRDLMLKKEQSNWTFTYIGQNPDAWAKNMHQSANNVCRYSMIEPRSNMQRNSTAVAIYRRNAATQSRNFYNPMV